ncbi:cyclase family protein [Gluconacetobacter takamatsuzukensis]|nr:cyclase family protein [Gluconacetobacter takamatsuzukensis]
MSRNKLHCYMPDLGRLLEQLPKNWGRWGENDEVGSLNFLTAEEVLRGVASVRQGRPFTLGVRIAAPEGDPIWPGRATAQRVNVMDRGHFMCGKAEPLSGGGEWADDMVVMYLQGSSQYDALGHVWYDDQLYNGYPATTTVGAMTKASVLPIAERGVVGRGVLIDMARFRGKECLDRGETFTHEDLEAAAAKQGVSIAKHDILLVRTGWIGKFYRTPKEEFYKDFLEPGLTYSPELVRWFHEREIPNLVTDTIANEVTVDPQSGVTLPLHCALMRNLGVTFTEIIALDALAADCAADGQWTFLYVAAPLKVVGGSGAPVNPVVIK